CRSAWRPLPAETLVSSRYEESMITPWPCPYPVRSLPSHHVSTGAPRYCCTRKSVAAVPWGRGSNQTGPPVSSTIIGPDELPPNGARKRKPSFIVCGFVPTAISGGWRPLSERIAGGVGAPTRAAVVLASAPDIAFAAPLQPRKAVRPSPVAERKLRRVSAGPSSNATESSGGRRSGNGVSFDPRCA